MKKAQGGDSIRKYTAYPSVTGLFAKKKVERAKKEGNPKNPKLVTTKGSVKTSTDTTGFSKGRTQFYQEKRGKSGSISASRVGPGEVRRQLKASKKQKNGGITKMSKKK